MRRNACARRELSRTRCVQVESPGRIVPRETSTAGARECDQMEPRERFHLIRPNPRKYSPATRQA